MKALETLLQNNREWSDGIRAHDPEYFHRLSQQQAAEYLWIGCSDSRVPANTIVGLAPGEVFVHRNVANLVKFVDMNCLSVIQFAVDVLRVRHMIVCGHYSCSGVHAVLSGHRLGLSDNWLGQVRDIRQKHEQLLDAQQQDSPKVDLLCKLNVIEQVANACRTTVVQDAWQRGQTLTVHGWIYGLRDGLIRDLDISVSRPDQIVDSYSRALALIASRSANRIET